MLNFGVILPEVGKSFFFCVRDDLESRKILRNADGISFPFVIIILVDSATDRIASRHVSRGAAAAAGK